MTKRTKTKKTKKNKKRIKPNMKKKGGGGICTSLKIISSSLFTKRKKKKNINKSTNEEWKANQSSSLLESLTSVFTKLPSDLSREFRIQSTSGNGDCFFDSLRLGLATNDQIFTIAQLRKIVADNIDFDKYDANMVEYYFTNIDGGGTGASIYVDHVYKPFTTEQNKIKDTINKLSTLDKQLEKASNPANIYKQINEITNKTTIENTRKQLINGFRNINEDEKKGKIKGYILSSSYWADAQAIQILSDHFNIQFIIFKNSNKQIECLNKGDIDQFNAYILIWWTDPVHYELMTTTEGRGYFTFDQLPDIIKSKICHRMKNPPGCIVDKKFNKNVCNKLNTNDVSTKSKQSKQSKQFKQSNQSKQSKPPNSASLYLFRIQNNFLQLLVCHRGVGVKDKDYGKIYTMGGKIENEKTPIETAKIESEEEAGVSIDLNKINKDPIMINTHPAFYAILSESDAYNVNVKGPTQGHEFEVKNDKDSYDFFDKLYNTDLCYKSKQVTFENWTGWAWVDINVIYQYIKEKQAERDNYIVAKVITKLIQIHEIKSYIKE